MIQNNHGHNLSKGNIIKIFYHGLCEITQEVLNAAAGGIFLYKTPNQAYQLLEDKVLLKLDLAKNQKTKSSLKKTVAFADDGSSNSDTDKIIARMDAMTLKMDAQYKELQSYAKKTKPDLDNDDIPMSCEEEVKFMQTFQTFMDLKTQLETVAKNLQASIQNLETKFDRLADKQSGRHSGSLPSNTQPTPKGYNFKAYQPPQARNEHVNAVFTRSAGLPNYEKFLKELIRNKHKIEQIYVAFLSDGSSTMIQNKVPPKLRDPGSFLIPCNFNKTFSCNALADLGASITLMPNSLYVKLSLKTLKPTKMNVRLTDRSFQYPIGIAENMLIEVGKFTFPADFVILEMEEDSKVPLILGRPFLHTGDAVIRVKQKQLNLGVGTERMIFNIDSTMKYSYSNEDTCFSIDVIDEILEEDFDAVLDDIYCMRTRASSNLVGESSTNPTTLNPKRRNHTMADQRTMAELLRVPTEGYAEEIVVPPILAEHFELKHSLINMMTSDQFFGLEKDNHHDHIRCDGNSSSSSEIAKLTHAVNQQTSVVTTAMTAILKQFQAIPPSAFVKSIEEICVTCGGAHPYYQCLAVVDNTFLEFQDNIQGYVSAATVNYNQGNSGYRPLGVANQIRPPGFAQPNVKNNQNRFSQPQVELKVITTRSGIILDGPFVPIPPPFINPEEDERVEETLTDLKLALLSNKEKLLELANTPLNENCSAVILKKLPEKLRDPREFIIPCGFSELKCKALADLGASINLMPLSVCKKLGLPELMSTCMTLELANRAICTPAEITRDVFVSIEKFTFPTDFVIVDYESNPRVPFILVDALPSTDNKDKVFNSGILIQENLSEVTVQATPDKNVKKIAISHASLILKDFNPPLSDHELPFHKEGPRSETLLSFSSKNEEKVFKPGILTSKGVYISLLSEYLIGALKLSKSLKFLKARWRFFLALLERTSVFRCSVSSISIPHEQINSGVRSS
nr:reverse transcriptase domain-containing protein [Tanacetum cinerariifolium]